MKVILIIFLQYTITRLVIIGLIPYPLADIIIRHFDSRLK